MLLSQKLILAVLTLLFTVLACLQPAALAQPTTSPTSLTFVKVDEEPAGAVYEIPMIAETRESQRCAQVIAEVALHLRRGASERTGVLGWMTGGEIVRVISADDADWWLIERGGVIGYARSLYLREVGCE